MIINHNMSEEAPKEVPKPTKFQALPYRGESPNWIYDAPQREWVRNFPRIWNVLLKFDPIRQVIISNDKFDYIYCRLIECRHHVSRIFITKRSPVDSSSAGESHVTLFCFHDGNIPVRCLYNGYTFHNEQSIPNFEELIELLEGVVYQQSIEFYAGDIPKGLLNFYEKACR